MEKLAPPNGAHCRRPSQHMRHTSVFQARHLVHFVLPSAAGSLDSSSLLGAAGCHRPVSVLEALCWHHRMLRRYDRCLRVPRMYVQGIDST
jgi:hypothetical protein